MKRLKDFLPYYLGCEGIDHNGERAYLGAGTLSKIFRDAMSFKPILRPLSDITEDEMFLLFGLNEHSFSSFRYYKGLKFDAENNCISGYGLRENGCENYVITYFHLLNSDQFRFLLDYHFDIFGLIEAGLAIDKTTIKMKKLLIIPIFPLSVKAQKIGVGAKSIWKYTLEVEDYQTLRIPEGFQALSVQVQNDTPCLWVLVDTEAPKVESEIYIYGNRTPILRKDVMHIGTFQLGEGSFVGHVFMKH